MAQKHLAEVSAKLPQWLRELIEPLRQLLLQMEVFVSELTKQVEAMAALAQQRPKGLGALTRNYRARSHRLESFQQPATSQQLHRAVSK